MLGGKRLNKLNKKQQNKNIINKERMSSKKGNLKDLYENLPTNKNKTKTELYKPTKLNIKNFGDKNTFEKEKAEFLKRKTKRYKKKKEDATLPAPVKTLVEKYGDVMTNVGASDMEKYVDYKKFKKDTKTTKGKK